MREGEIPILRGNYSSGGENCQEIPPPGLLYGGTNFLEHRDDFLLSFDVGDNVDQGCRQQISGEEIKQSINCADAHY